MKFESILYNLKNGEQIRRKSWNKDKYIQVINDNMYDQNDSSYSLPGYDLFANDWELCVDWDYVINNFIPCWFWDEDKKQKRIGFLVKVWDNVYSLKFNLDDDNTYEFKNCEPVKAEEYRLY